MSLMERLVAFTLRRRITVLMLALSAVLVGAISYVGLPLELLPSGFQGATVTLHIPVPSSNPMEVQEQVVRPTEEAVRTIPGIEEIASSARATRARIRVSFRRSVDLDLATAELRDRLERARVQWPDQVKDYYIWRFNLDQDLPVLSFAIDLDRYSDEVTFLVEEKVIKPLEALPGVARVACWGLLDDQVRVYVDRNRALAQGVAIYELTQALRKANVEVTGGEIEEGGVRYTVRTNARILGVDDLRALPINRRGLQLGQIARIEPTKAVREFLALSRNKRSLWCRVYKESSANTVETAARVRRLVAEDIVTDARLAELGASPRLHDGADFGLMITSALATLRKTAATGAVLALLVLFFFLRRLRLTLVITLSIPLTLLITLGGLYFGGGSLNLLSMLGVTVAIGMLIDNSIVVAENIARHREKGATPREAAFRGASEVALAITMSTMTTVAAFIPLVFLGTDDWIAFLTRGIGVALCLSVMLSLLVALVFIPLATIVLRSGARGRAPRSWQRSRLVEALRRAYVGTLTLALTNRLYTVLIVVAAVAVPTWLAWKAVPLSDVRSESGGRIRLGVDLDSNFTLSDAHRTMRRIGNWLDEHADDYAIEHFWCFFRSRGGRFNVELAHQDMARTRETAKRLDEVLPELPGVKYSLGIEDQRQGDEGLTVSIFGPDPAVLLRLARGVSERLERMDAILAVTSDMEDGQEELHIVPDREKTARYGIDPRWLRGTIEYGIRGFWFSDLVKEEREIPLIVQYEGADKRSLRELRDYPIPTQGGERVPLSNVAELVVRRGLGEIRRRDGRAQATLTLEVGSDDQKALIAAIHDELADFPLPEGYSWKDNKGEELDAAASEMAVAGLLSITFVFLLMGVLFESVVLPFAVLAAIPFSWCGALWTLGLTGTPLDFVGVIGVFVLVGVVVNNGIVLLDCAHRHLHGRCARLARTRPRRARLLAFRAAGRERFRPILMTAATTVVGLVPMALADSGGSRISYRALSLVVIGGLLCSTFFTLVFVPLLYSLTDDTRRTVRGLVLSLRGRGARRRALGPEQAPC